MGRRGGQTVPAPCSLTASETSSAWRRCLPAVRALIGRPRVSSAVATACRCWSICWSGSCGGSLPHPIPLAVRLAVRLVCHRDAAFWVPPPWRGVLRAPFELTVAWELMYTCSQTCD
jgi:hypothetical protein